MILLAIRYIYISEFLVIYKKWKFYTRVVSLDWLTDSDFGKKFRSIRKEDKLNYKI